MNLIPKFSEAAEWDIADIVSYFDDRNDSVSERFYQAVEETVRMLCNNPEIGEIFQGDPTGTIRHRTIVKFRSYLIFYRRVDSVLEIVRIIHGARDYEKLFE